ncbi:YscX family type III secretion protein [Shewanella psychropiezotolerans]|uniref:YscX family type III secretion protein n=1 Tax=Shewanella psychropiezotolerans TaxID=2593655 RepID=A0ABX5X521_9GAMM|nr:MULTISPECIES: YscX family type III secretion protein [Shewanella]MPY25674.1 YscX family type III secretion protein [Shewanella sp. YLB-07]QDO86356.1 YscX family type III secretion protein [Shewanella psychropiezotolerans]
MSKVTAAHIGIEHLSFHSSDELDNPFPARFSLPPDGEAIPTHLDKLYELSPGERTLKSLSNPKISDMSLLRPKQYQDTFKEITEQLERLASQLKSDDLQDALALMKQTKLDQDYLSLAFHLLLRV